jgi:hypothetical protein
MVYERKMPAESLMNLSNPFATTYKHMHEAEQMGARSLSVLIPALREVSSETTNFLAHYWLALPID